MIALGIPVQRAAIARWRGDLAPEAALTTRVMPFLPYPRLAALFSTLRLDRVGDRAAALSMFDEAWADTPASLGRDWVYAMTLTTFAEVAIELGLPDRCRDLEPLLKPYDGQFILNACTDLRGSTGWFLGGLARAQGRLDEAIGHYERALALETANGAVLMAARTRAALDELR